MIMINNILKYLILFIFITFSTFIESCKKDNKQTPHPDEKLIDIDGNQYNTVWIGEQLWMAENLKVTRYPNGDTIPLITEDSIWKALDDNNISDAYCYYNNSEINKNKYGGLYTYAAAKNACPTGWHLPNEKEWSKLINFIKDDGYNETEALAIKSISGWLGTNNGYDIYGFTALPGGGRCFDGPFDFIKSYARWWSKTEYDENFAYGHGINYDKTIIGNCERPKSVGFSIRCIKD